MKHPVLAVILATATLSPALTPFPSQARSGPPEYVHPSGIRPVASATTTFDAVRTATRLPVSRAANGVDGAWAEFNLLQVRWQMAAYDAPHDRLLSIGGSRTSSWALPLSGNAVWQPLSETPTGALGGSGPGRRVFDHSTGLVYYVGFDISGFVIHTYDPQTGITQALAPSGPQPPIAAAMLAFDEGARRLLLLMFSTDFPPSSVDVWALDLLPSPAWSHWTPSGTAPALPPGAIPPLFDPVRRRLLLDGEFFGADGTVWALTLDGPPQWLQFACGVLPGGAATGVPVYDPATDLYWTINANGELFTFSPTAFAWTQQSTIGPGATPRKNPGLALDSARHRLLVNGGASPSEDDVYSDAWAVSLDMPHAWTQIAPDAVRPPIRGGASDGYDAGRHRLVVFGGSNEVGGFRNDVWAVDLGLTPQWSPIATQGTPPPPRYWHASAWDDAHDRLVTFGGYNGDFYHLLGDVWALSFDGGTPTWTSITPSGSAPAGRMLANLIYDSTQDRFLLLFGDDGTQLHQDVWELRLEPSPAWRQLSPAGGPPPVRGASMCVFDAARNRVIAFGGGNTGGMLNDLWALNLASGDGTWVPIAAAPGPSARNLGLLRLDTTHDRLLLFGGYGIESQTPNLTFINYLNDSWTLDLGGTPTWHARSPSGFPPSGRDRANGAYDPVYDRLIVACGGINGGNDLFALSSGDSPTATQLSLASLDVTADRVRIIWAGAGPADVVTVYRRTATTPWTTLETTAADGRGMIEYEDRDVTPGARYQYRLGVMSGTEEAFYGATWADIPRYSLSLAARVIGGGVSFTVGLSGDAPATLALFDVSGRRVWNRAIGSLGAGSHEVRVNDVALAPALYFARLSQAGETRMARVAVTR